MTAFPDQVNSHPSASVRDVSKIGMIGAGAVGRACLISTIMRGFAQEIVLVNRDRNMVSARIAGIVSRDERTVIPIGSYNPNYGGTLSLPGVVGRQGIVQILEPEMSEKGRRGLERSTETLRSAVSQLMK